MSTSRMDDVEPLEKPVDEVSLSSAMTAFFEVWNMDCSHCATWVRNGLLRLEGVLIVDVFFKQGIAVAIYDPQRVTLDDLLKAIEATGKDICHYYGAELIGQQPAAQALHLCQ